MGAGEPPAWATWHARSCTAQVTGADRPDQLVVGGRRLWLRVDGATAFAAPDAWQVSDALACDLDADGRDEVVALVWKVGSYGSSRPFWVERDEEGFSQHIFVLRWKEGGAAAETAGGSHAGAGAAGGSGSLQPAWMSSRLGVEVDRMRVDDAGLLELTARDGARTRWSWGAWGFELVETVAAPEGPTGSARGATVLAVGDNIAHEVVYEGAYRPEARAFDFAPVYEPVRALVGAADLAVVGQETVLVRDPALRSGYPLFATPCALGDALADAGFDAVLAASNHVNDKGAAGLESTLAFWESEHPEVLVLGLRRADAGEAAGAGGADGAVDAAGAAGAGRPSGLLDARPLDIAELPGGIRLALFDYTYGLNGRPLAADAPYQVDVLDEAGVARLLADLGRARAEADLAVCFLHIGAEYASAPTAEQRALVERLVDAGADAVVCAHAHVLAPYQRLRTPAGNEGVVYWSLGNFVAVQDDVACALGGAALLTVEKVADGGAGSPGAPGASAGVGVGVPGAPGAGVGAGADVGAPGARIVDFELVPTVCHTSRAGAVTVWPLAEYTAELAADHYLNDLGHQVSVEGLWDLYAAETQPAE